MSDYQVLLYYKYTTIDDPETFAKEHLAACKEMELKGRILVATEGINGTVSGTVEATNKYMDYMATMLASLIWYLKLTRLMLMLLRKCMYGLVLKLLV